MLPSKNRLVSEREFRRVYRKGATFFSDYLLIKIAPNNSDYTRIGIVVSKKISKKAVVRNAIKRSIRELIRPMLAKIKRGYDCILIPKKSYKLAKVSEKKRSIDILLKRSKIY
ncbi:ribonuclease P protein component [Patescibacteria group bacterium]|nr:ribonuclease P protein component [Patescibacteria group bacterium]MBU1890960.1 ribonuclease P protein component [Patescibacteria group bacterium]